MILGGGGEFEGAVRREEHTPQGSLEEKPWDPTPLLTHRIIVPESTLYQRKGRLRGWNNPPWEGEMQVGAYSLQAQVD